MWWEAFDWELTLPYTTGNEVVVPTPPVSCQFSAQRKLFPLFFITFNTVCAAVRYLVNNKGKYSADNALYLPLGTLYLIILYSVLLSQATLLFKGIE